MLRFWLPAICSLLFDQLTKLTVLKFLAQPLLLIPGILTLRLVSNPGVAFGFFPYQKLFIIIVSISLGAAVLAGYQKLRNSPVYWQCGLGFIFGGMLGNLIDRLRFGYVVDFVDLGFWPVFNLADAAIVCGAALITLGVFRNRQGGGSKKAV